MLEEPRVEPRPLQLGQATRVVRGDGAPVLPGREDVRGDRTAGFAAAPGVEYIVHAVRGPFTRRTLLTAGIEAPAVYGDPAWFMPRILRPRVEKPTFRKDGVWIFSATASVFL